MSIKSEWRLAELLGSNDNPFDTVVLSTGLQVDLTGSEEDVVDGIMRSLDLEGRYFGQGITCELKDGGQDCLTCPMYVADREEEARAPLCRLGRDQRLMETRFEELASIRKAQPFTELAEAADAFAELGEVPAEYEELLTAVGL